MWRWLLLLHLLLTSVLLSFVSYKSVQWWLPCLLVSCYLRNRWDDHTYFFKEQMKSNSSILITTVFLEQWSLHDSQQFVFTVGLRETCRENRLDAKSLCLFPLNVLHHWLKAHKNSQKASIDLISSVFSLQVEVRAWIKLWSCWTDRQWAQKC